MKKLELKHIAPYLPYKLNVKILNYKCDYVGKEYGVLGGYYYINGEPHYYVSKDHSQAGKDSSLFLPILRPLSDLTKEIEHNGKKFVPSDCGLYIKVLAERGYMNGMEYHETIEQLHEWHFDTKNLIDLDLAVDINTLKQ